MVQDWRSRYIFQCPGAPEFNSRAPWERRLVLFVYNSYLKRSVDVPFTAVSSCPFFFRVSVSLCSVGMSLLERQACYWTAIDIWVGTPSLEVRSRGVKGRGHEEGSYERREVSHGEDGGGESGTSALGSVGEWWPGWWELGATWAQCWVRLLPPWLCFTWFSMFARMLVSET